MDTLQVHSKAIAAALATLVVLILKPFMPEVMTDPAFQGALEVVLGALIIGLSVWLAPANKPKEPSA